MSTESTRPWVEKYRPNDLTEVSHQVEVVSTLQNAVETNRLPHLLFYGPPGTGKTSVALALCKTLWHPSEYKRRVLELNASDERGISVVRNKIKHFASLSVGTKAVAAPKKSFFGKSSEEDVVMEEKKPDEKTYPSPPFKVIILDEADTVTPDAQAALRRIIEAHSKITRFILICNYVTRIIDPLSSRCAKFRFQPLPPESMKNRLLSIIQEEKVKFSNDGSREEVLEEIMKLSHGDMRRAVTMLQSAHTLSGGRPIQKESISEITGFPPLQVTNSLLETLRDPKTHYEPLESKVSDVMMDGYAAQHILSKLLKDIIELDEAEMSDVFKAEIAIKIAEVDKILIDGADEYLQLLVVCSLVLQCFKRMATLK